MCIGTRRPSPAVAVRRRLRLVASGKRSRRASEGLILPVAGRRSSASAVALTTVNTPDESVGVTPSPSPEPAKKKSVAFAPVESTVASYIPTRSELSNEEKCSVWLSTAELENIKDRAREVGRTLRSRMTTDDGASSSSEVSDSETGEQEQRRRSLVDEEDLSCSRGFDLRLSYVRQRNRCLATKAVLRYSDQLSTCPSSSSNDPVQRSLPADLRLALLSSHLTRWSREIALAAGQSDFLDAYDMFRGVLPPPRTMEEISREHAFPLGDVAVPKKRSGGVHEVEGRSVRRRVA